MPTLQTLGINRLSREDRLRFIGEIWDSLDQIEEVVPESHRLILEERLQRSKEFPEAIVLWM